MELLGNISSDRITIDELRIMLIDIIRDFTIKQSIKKITIRETRTQKTKL